MQFINTRHEFLFGPWTRECKGVILALAGPPTRIEREFKKNIEAENEQAIR